MLYLFQFWLPSYVSSRLNLWNKSALKVKNRTWAFHVFFFRPDVYLVRFEHACVALHDPVCQLPGSSSTRGVGGGGHVYRLRSDARRKTIPKISQARKNNTAISKSVNKKQNPGTEKLRSQQQLNHILAKKIDQDSIFFQHILPTNHKFHRVRRKIFMAKLLKLPWLCSMETACYIDIVVRVKRIPRRQMLRKANPRNTTSKPLQR